MIPLCELVVVGLKDVYTAEAREKRIDESWSCNKNRKSNP